MKSVLRRLPTSASRFRPSLSALKTTLQIVNSAGTSVPGLQAAVGTVLQIIEYAEAVKQNRKDARELAVSAAQTVEALLQATEDLKTGEIDDAFRKDVVDFHNELLKISTTLKSLTEQAIWRRALKRNEHATAIAKHRRNLAHTIKDGITNRRLMVRQHRELQNSLGSLSTMVAAQLAPLTPGLPAATSTSLSQNSYQINVPNFVHITIDLHTSMLAKQLPGLQAAVGTVLQIIEYAEAVKRNRDDARDLAVSAAQIVEALLQATEDLRTDEVDEAFRADIVDFHNELLRISTTLQDLVKRDVWHRLLNRDGHAAAIVEHRRNLAHAITVFQIKDGITSRRLMVRQHRELRDSIGSLSTMVAERHSLPPIPSRAASPQIQRLSPVIHQPDSKSIPRLHMEIDISAAMSAL
ncbi:hypothetical protein ONZ51_g1833 [Trametes cubensis]|uniref:Uncharacterized protein n=1 Tax=Trametes cubensis TaxID=1111947 RepID=A0AAD7U347_9APHY|nr:hypothetical protein ONZ51_g1833 [Trametes cubensis]